MKTTRHLQNISLTKINYVETKEVNTFICQWNEINNTGKNEGKNN